MELVHLLNENLREFKHSQIAIFLEMWELRDKVVSIYYFIDI